MALRRLSATTSRQCSRCWFQHQSRSNATRPMRFQQVQNVGSRRQFSNGGFFSNLKKQLEEELAKSKDLKEGIDKLKHDKSLNRAAEKAGDAASKAGRQAGSFGSKAKDAAQRAAEKAKETAEKAAQQATEKSAQFTESGSRFTRLADKMKSFGGTIGSKAKATAAAASERSEMMKDAVEEKVTKAASDASDTSYAREASERLQSSKKVVSSNPYMKSVVAAMKDAKLLDGWSDAAQELMGKKKTMRTVKVSSPPEMAPPKDGDEDDEDEEDEEDDKNAYKGPGALMAVEAERSNWEKFSQRLSRTPIIEDILSGAKKAQRAAGRSKVGKAAGQAKSTIGDMREEARERWETSQNPWVYRLSAAYDATFAETETAQCINEVRRLDPEFNVHLWLDELRDDTIPHVIGSYLRMDDDALKADLSEGAFATVGAAIGQRRKEGLTMDPNLLQMNDPDLIAAQLVDRGPPIFVCSVLAQQINCFRNKKNGKIVEGAEDDIRYVFYIFALQRDYNEQLAELEWKVVEMRVQMMDPMI